jgi:hypothetical protein
MRPSPRLGRGCGGRRPPAAHWFRTGADSSRSYSLLACRQHPCQVQTVSIELTQHQLEVWRGYSQGQVTAIDLRRRLGTATYGEFLACSARKICRCRGRRCTGVRSNWNARVDGCSRRMSHSLKLFVIDAAPLITLTVAYALDYLLHLPADIRSIDQVESPIGGQRRALRAPCPRRCSNGGTLRFAGWIVTGQGFMQADTWKTICQ